MPPPDEPPRDESLDRGMDLAHALTEGFLATVDQVMKKWWASLSEDEREAQIAKTLVATQAGRKAKAEADPDWERRRAENIRLAHAARTPEEKAEAARKRLETFPSEMRSAAVKRFHESQTPEERRIRVNGTQTAEQRSERGRKAAAARSPEERSESARRGHAKASPEVKEAQRRRGSSLGAGKRWITNGERNTRIAPTDPVPPGWRYGKVRKSQPELPL